MYIQEQSAQDSVAALEMSCRVCDLNQVACEGIELLSILRERICPDGANAVIFEKVEEAFSSVMNWCINFDYLQEKKEVV